jgi:hypothetical protein
MKTFQNEDWNFSTPLGNRKDAMPRQNVRILPPVETFERPLVEDPPLPIRRFNWLKLYVWLGAILFCLACWAGVIVLVSWWVQP